MIETAAHIGIFGLLQSDDFLRQQEREIRKLRRRIITSQTVPTLEWARDLALAIEEQGQLSDRLSKGIGARVQHPLSSSNSTTQNLQVAVCGILAALRILRSTQLGGSSSARRDKMATGLWSALSFQKPRSEWRLERLRAELLHTAREKTLHTGRSSRKRIENLQLRLKANAYPEDVQIDETVSQAHLVTENRLLRDVLNLTREENDLLRWQLNSKSTILKRSFTTDETPHAIALAGALEVGQVLRHLPSDDHRRLALRNVRDASLANLHELLGLLGHDREQLADVHRGSAAVAAYPNIFPLLAAVQTGSASGANADVQRSLEEWAARALLESAAAKLIACD